MQRIADMHLVGMLADTASLSLLPQVEKGKLIDAPLDNKVGTYFMVNQSNNRRQINHDVSQFFEQRLGDKLLGMIHRDFLASVITFIPNCYIDYRYTDGQ